MKEAYLIQNIEEYGKLMAYCIENDISVFRTYWDEREKGVRCYQTDFREKRCYQSSIDYYQCEGYKITVPVFEVDKYGRYKITRKEGGEADA